jgi:hypothetical protein
VARTVSIVAVRLGALLGVLVGAFAGAPPAAAGPAEQRYLEEEDDAKAEPLLTALLAKHKTPKDAVELVKVLRARKAKGDLKKDRGTFDWPCPDGKTRQLTYLLPSKHNPSKPAGVMVWLHGAVRQPAPGGGAGEAEMFRPAVDDLGLIVVGPSTYDGVEWGAAGPRALVHHALRLVKTSFLVDDNRVYVCGDSDGGRGTFRTVEAEATTFAAAVPVIGSPGGVTRFVNLRNLPWFAINGDQDTIFDVAHVREAVDGMKAAGFDLTWKLVEGGGHDPRFFLRYGEEVRAFLKRHPRDPYPKKVEWTVDPSDGEAAGRFPANTFRWIRLEEAGASERSSTFEDAGVVRGGLPRVEATRDGNRIVVKTSGVRRVTVLASDPMLDLGKDVEVVVNDVVLFRGRVTPDPRVVLEEGRRFLDRALVFSARITLDVDAPAVPPSASDAPPAGK